MSIEYAKSVLAGQTPKAEITEFCGVDIELLDKEDLIELVTWLMRDCASLNKAIAQNQRMYDLMLNKDKWS